MTLDQLKGLLPNVSLNGRGDHFVSDCVFCNKERHFYINITKCFKKSGRNYVSSWDCKKCGARGNILKLLTKLRKTSLLLDGNEVDTNKLLNNKLIDDVITSEEIDYTLPVIKLPIGFKRVYSNPYLNNRGFTKLEFEKYKIGTTNLVPSLEEYIIISIQESNKDRGFISRSTLSKQEINEINEEYKKSGSKQRYLRYKNSKNTEFNKLLIGYDEIMFTTEWVVLVEGYFDKVRVDQALSLDFDDSIKCCATFGKSISIEQIRKLQRRGVSNVILIQDPDAVKDSKHIAFQLNEEFENVLVGYTGHKDLGDSSYSEVGKVFENLKKPQEFNLDILQLYKLR